MKTYKHRFNPFNRSFEVLEHDDETRFWKVKYYFNNQHDAVDCERRLKHHDNLFRVREKEVA